MAAVSYIIVLSTAKSDCSKWQWGDSRGASAEEMSKDARRSFEWQQQTRKCLIRGLCTGGRTGLWQQQRHSAAAANSSGHSCARPGDFWRRPAMLERVPSVLCMVKDVSGVQAYRAALFAEAG